MKKFILFITLGFIVFVISLNAFSQENNEEAKETITSIEIEKSPQQLERERRQIEERKRELKEDIFESQASNEGLPLEEGQSLATKQGVLEKKHDVLTAKEQVVNEKIRAYEQVAMLIERKIQILNKKDLTLRDIRREITKTRSMLSRLERQENIVKRKISIVDLELKAIEKEFVAQKTLMELKGSDAGEIDESIKANEDRIEQAHIEIELINERLSFIDIQIDITKDFLDILIEKRIDMFKNLLFMPKPYRFRFLDLIIFMILAGGLPLVKIARKRIKNKKPDERKSVFKKTLSNVLGIIFFWGLGSGAAYFIMSFLGYKEFAVYLIPRVIFLVVTITFLLFVYRVLDVLLHKISLPKEDEDEEETAGHTFVDAMMTLFGWVIFLSGIYFVTEILGVTPEVMNFTKNIMQKSFFTFGKVDLSAWVLIKAGFIIWLFIVSSNILDALLKNNVYQRIHLDESVQYTFSVAIKYLMLAIGIMIGLSSLGVELAALTVFAGTIGIGIGFGLQDIAKNFISGLVMLIERPIKVGDYIEVKDLPGKVRAIKARSTVVDTFDNISVIVPNADFMNQQVVNWSYSDKLTRLKISVGVAYGSDVEIVKQSLIEVAKKHQRVLHHPEPYVWFSEFGDSSLNFNLFIWTKEPDKRFKIKSDLNFMINKIFKEKGITIPFPQRDIHFKSSNVPLK